MDLLFLSHRLPYPPNRGDKIRSHAWFRHLSQKHRVHLACFVDDAADLAHLETVRSIAGGECFFAPIPRLNRIISGIKALWSGQPISTSYFGSQALTNWVRHTTKTSPIAGAVVFSSSMAPYLLDQTSLDPARALFDMVDVDSDKWRQFAEHARWPMRWIYQREEETLLELERRAASTFGATVLVSPHEVQHFQSLGGVPANRVHAIGNGVDTDLFAPGPFDSPFQANEIPIVMTGRMDYRPNIDGALWFVDEVLPRVRERIAHARFYIVGANPVPRLTVLRRPDVVVTGQVADVRPYLQHAAAVVAPLKITRGLQNKVLEAFSMEKPVVATSGAVQALSVERGSEAWVEDEAWGFARAVRAAVDGCERYRIAANARAFVLRNHAWRQKLGEFEALFDDLVGGRVASESAMFRAQISQSAGVPTGQPNPISMGAAR